MLMDGLRLLGRELVCKHKGWMEQLTLSLIIKTNWEKP